MVLIIGWHESSANNLLGNTIIFFLLFIFFTFFIALLWIQRNYDGTWLYSTFYLLFYFLYISSEFLILFFTLMSSCERICKSMLVSYCIYAHSWNVVSVRTKPKEVVNNIGQSSMKFKYAHLLLTLGYIFPIFCLKH